MDILKAKDIARETAKLNKSFSQVMNLAIQLKEDNDELKRQRDEALGKLPLFEKNEAEASELKAEDLKPALILALCQRDVALRSVRKIHKISDLIDTWDGNTPENWNNGPRADHIVGHIKDVILKSKEVV